MAEIGKSDIFWKLEIKSLLKYLNRNAIPDTSDIKANIFKIQASFSGTIAPTPNNKFTYKQVYFQLRDSFSAKPIPLIIDEIICFINSNKLLETTTKTTKIEFWDLSKQFYYAQELYAYLYNRRFTSIYRFDFIRRLNCFNSRFECITINLCNILMYFLKQFRFDE